VVTNQASAQAGGFTGAAAKVERLLIERGITIHPSSRMRRYMT
jgi:protein involved in polysaccharide export with SLBB domain